MVQDVPPVNGSGQSTADAITACGEQSTNATQTWRTSAWVGDKRREICHVHIGFIAIFYIKATLYYSLVRIFSMHI